MSTILLIDDDEDMSRLVINWLKKSGYEVFFATSGQDALEQLAAVKVDLILLDYAMPEMDGPQVFKALQADDRFRDIPVLFRTGMDDDLTTDLVDELGAKGVVPKSQGKASLLSAVSEILQ